MSPPEGQKRRMVALYDYDPHELSPNVDAEVKMHQKLYSDTRRTKFQRVGLCLIPMKFLLCGPVFLSILISLIYGFVVSSRLSFHSALVRSS